MRLSIQEGRPAAVAQDVRRAVWAYMDSTGLRGVFVKVLGDTAIVERPGGVMHLTAREGDRFSITYTGNALADTALDRPDVGRAEMVEALLDWLHVDDRPGPAAPDPVTPDPVTPLRRAAPLALAGLAALLAYQGARRFTAPRPGLPRTGPAAGPAAGPG